MFTDSNHDDSMIFDGLDGEQAHSFPLADNEESQFKGHVHLDDEEDWSGDKRKKLKNWKNDLLQ